MQDAVKIGTAAAGGYLLGRTKKAKAAIGLALWLAGRRRPSDLARDQAMKVVRSDRGQELLAELRGPVLDAGKQAALSLFETHAGRLGDALQRHTEAIGADGQGKRRGRSARASDADEYDDEDEYEDAYDDEDDYDDAYSEDESEDEYDDGQPEDDDRGDYGDDDADEPEGEYDDEYEDEYDDEDNDEDEGEDEGGYGDEDDDARDGDGYDLDADDEQDDREPPAERRAPRSRAPRRRATQPA